jgi:hypothetical protein
VVDRFSQVVQQTRSFSRHDVDAEFRGQKPGDVRDFYGVVQYVLPVTRPVSLTADELDDLAVQAVYARLECRAFALGLDGRVHFFLGLLDHFLDSSGMDTAVNNQFFERDAGYLATDRVKA